MIINISIKPKLSVCLILNGDHFLRHVSYYPEYKQKNKRQILLDQLRQIWKFGYPNQYYFSYGFDVKSKQVMQEYLHYNPFMIVRDKYNYIQHGSTAILRDKVFFGMFCDYLGVESGKNIGITFGENVFSIALKKQITLEEFCNSYSGEFFVKLINGECGKGIFKLKITAATIYIDDSKSDIGQLKRRIKNSTYLIQETVKQHHLMSALHKESINTIRLVTIKNVKTNKIELFPSILRIGTGKSIVDNTSQGGIAVGIDSQMGRLKEYGFFKPEFGGRVSIHPDSNIKFAEFIIPFWKEAGEQAKLLHSMLPDIHSVGWDISIGESGPIFIEGNDNWEINGPQICHGGLKRVFNRLLLG